MRVGLAFARTPRRRFVLACAVEGALLFVAAAVAWPAGVPLLADLHWSAADLALGLAATLPMFAVPWWVTRTRYPPAVSLCEQLEALLDFFRGWSRGELVALSIVAGVSEEVLFRAVVQGGLAGPLGEGPALVIAALVFGAAHPVSRLYVALAAVVGAWLGVIWLLAGNLLVPVVAHAAYDAAVLLWLLHPRRRTRPAA